MTIIMLMISVFFSQLLFFLPAPSSGTNLAGAGGQRGEVAHHGVAEKVQDLSAIAMHHGHSSTKHIVDSLKRRKKRRW